MREFTTTMTENERKPTHRSMAQTTRAACRRGEGGREKEEVSKSTFSGLPDLAAERDEDAS